MLFSGNRAKHITRDVLGVALPGKKMLAGLEGHENLAEYRCGLWAIAEWSDDTEIVHFCNWVSGVPEPLWRSFKVQYTQAITGWLVKVFSHGYIKIFIEDGLC